MFRYNLLFFVSGGGKFNYQGTKRWLEDNLDHTGTVEFIGLTVFWIFIEQDVMIHAARFGLTQNTGARILEPKPEWRQFM